MEYIATLALIGADSPAARNELAGGNAVETAFGIVKPTAPEAIEGAIFDLDGTLLDSMPWWDDLGERYLRSRGKTPNPDIRYHFKRMTMEQSTEYMKTTYGLEESLEEICAGVKGGIEDAYRHAIPCKPGVVDKQQAFQTAGVRMCVATASRRDVVLAALQRLDILRYFSAVFTCSEVGASKTEPTVFEVSLKHLGTPRNATMVFEDSLHAIETAHAAGFPVALVDEPANAGDAEQSACLADIRVKSFTAFSRL